MNILNKSSPILFLMIEEEHKGNIIDHVEMVDEKPEMNDLATDPQRGH
jgi:hypothetical protein